MHELATWRTARATRTRSRWHSSGDLLCTKCHQDFAPGGSRAMPLASGGGEPKAAAVDAHTRHPAASAGARCVNCHMSDVNWRLLIRRRDHTFKPPVPEMTARLGVPNECTECHEDRTPEWAAARMDEWYGDGERRAREMRVAETMSAAALGDVSALRGLASIVVDRGQRRDVARERGGAHRAPSPTTMPMLETYDALKRGLADGVLLPIETLKGWKFGEVCKYTYENPGNSYANGFFITMNKEKWNAMPKDIQEIINQVNAEWFEKQAKIWTDIDDEGREFAIKAGQKIVCEPRGTGHYEAENEPYY